MAFFNLTNCFLYTEQRIDLPMNAGARQRVLLSIQ